jgi:threonine aldolase
MQQDVATSNRDEVMRSCTKFFGHLPRSVRARLAEISGAAGEAEYPDVYGSGALLETFESEIAQLLGKEAAVFMPSGTMAQQIALRIHSDRRNCRNVALHPQSHLVVSENNGMQMLHGLQPVLLGDRNALYTLADLQAVRDRLSAVLLELPERNIGGALRPWDEVLAMCEWAREANVAMHLDGARLWESQPFYGLSLPELTRPFDTVYVSFYKILNAVAGAALAGPKEIVEEARAWQWRHGGRLVQQYPMIVSARDGLRRYLPRVPLYCKRAGEIAAVLSSIEGIVISPAVPPTNMMHVYVRGEVEQLRSSALDVSAQSGVWMPARWNSTQIPGWAMCELSCAEGSLEISDDQVRELFGRIVAA